MSRLGLLISQIPIGPSATSLMVRKNGRSKSEGDGAMNAKRGARKVFLDQNDDEMDEDDEDKDEDDERGDDYDVVEPFSSLLADQLSVWKSSSDAPSPTLNAILTLLTGQIDSYPPSPPPSRLPPYRLRHCLSRCELSFLLIVRVVKSMRWLTALGAYWAYSTSLSSPSLPPSTSAHPLASDLTHILTSYSNAVRRGQCVDPKTSRGVADVTYQLLQLCASSSFSIFSLCDVLSLPSPFSSLSLFLSFFISLFSSSLPSSLKRELP